MKANMRNFFSLSITDDEYFNDKQEKFELESCPKNEMFCKKLLPAINKDYLVSQQFQLDKNYQKAIEALNNAYNKTLLLTEPTCAGCADFFRDTIKQSLLEVKKEQQKMSYGLFNLKRYRIVPVNFETILNKVESY